MSQSTICALATPRGQGGIAIIRVSGPMAIETLRGIFIPTHPRHAFCAHRMMHGRIVDPDGSEFIDEVLAVVMPAPYSYTREDVAEIHCHGGEISARRVLNLLMNRSILPAAPGEFTKRAFLNGRVDLAQAEAVMQLIGASSEAAARASVRQLAGGVSGFVREAGDGLLRLLALIEAGIDFPDEVEETAVAAEVEATARAILGEMERRCDPRGARILRQGASIVLAGRPNVGKSSLMNALLHQDRAIVTPIPGTTRDVLTERLTLGGILAELSDTAGQRDTQDPVERIGVDRARAAMDAADVLLIVLDLSAPLQDADRELLAMAGERTILLLNKCDLPPAFDPGGLPPVEALKISAATGQNIEVLLKALEARLSREASEDSLTVERHLKLAQEACEALRSALAALSAQVPMDMVALDLKQALALLSEITAQNPTETLIDEIFSTFCVGK